MIVIDPSVEPIQVGRIADITLYADSAISNDVECLVKPLLSAPRNVHVGAFACERPGCRQPNTVRPARNDHDLVLEPFRHDITRLLHKWRIAPFTIWRYPPLNKRIGAKNFDQRDFIAC